MIRKRFQARWCVVLVRFENDDRHYWILAPDIVDFSLAEMVSPK